MTVNFFNSSQATTEVQMSGNEMQAQSHIATPVSCRKRKEMDEDLEDSTSIVESRPALKGLRQFSSTSRNGDEQAHFYPLPHDLNMQLLANLGYMQPSSSNAMPRDLSSHSGVSHSPTSSFSDFGGPSTPSDTVGSTESYFSKGMRDSTACYPTFDIYPGNDNRPRSPGLLGMHMPAPSVGSADANGMQMDGMEDVGPDTSTHGPHCKSIPQLHVRSEPGVCSELWAVCPDCGTRSKVDAPPISDALSYSP